MLGDMTDIWYITDMKLAKFMLDQKIKYGDLMHMNPFELYNRFVTEMQVELDDPDLVEWCITRIRDFRSDSIEVLAETVRLNQKHRI